MELPLLGMQSLSVQLPLLTSLPSSALPAAVAAGLGQYAVQAALGGPEGEAAAAGAAAAEGGRAAENGRGVPPATAQSVHTDELPTGTAADGAGEAGGSSLAGGNGATRRSPAATPGTPGGAATPDLLIASPFKVAMALAEELDGSGLPLGMLPQAIGQVEPEASVSAPALPATGKPCRAGMHERVLARCAEL